MELKNKIIAGILIGAFLIAEVFVFSYAEAQTVFLSRQVGSNATTGYVLQTNGATSTWVATSSLGVGSGGGSVSTSSDVTAFRFPYWSNTTGGLAGTSSIYYNSSTNNVGIGAAPTQGSILDVTGSIYATTNVAAGNSFYFPASSLLMYATAAIDDSGNAYTFTNAGGSTARQIKASSLRIAATQNGAELALINASGGAQFSSTVTLRGAATSTITGDGTESSFGGNIALQNGAALALYPGVADLINYVSLIPVSTSSIGIVGFGNTAILDVSNLNTADRTFTFPDVSGTFALGTGIAGRCAEWNATNTLTSAAGACGVGGNPTAVADVTAVNGVATTFMRSDGAPAIARKFASSSEPFSLYNATTTTSTINPVLYHKLVWDYPQVISKISCYEVSGTTTIRIYKSTGMATTTVLSDIVASLVCGATLNTVTSFTSSTLLAGEALIMIPTSTAGTPQLTTIEIDKYKN